MTPLERWLERLTDPRDWVPMITLKLEATLVSLDERFQAWRARRRRDKELEDERTAKVAAQKAATIEFHRQLEIDDAAHPDEMAALIDTIRGHVAVCADSLQKESRPKVRLVGKEYPPDRKWLGYATLYAVPGGFLWATEESDLFADDRLLDLSKLHYRDLEAVNARLERAVAILA
jgi:hypothetical protein